MLQSRNDTLPGYNRPRRSGTGLPTPRSLRNGSFDWNGLLCIVLGVISFVLFFGFLSRGQSIEQLSTQVGRLQEELTKVGAEASHLRSSVNYMEQEMSSRDNAAMSLKREVNQYRDQSDRLDSMLEGYRGQVHRLEVQLTHKDRDCKIREEELEAAVAEVKAEQGNMQKQVQDGLDAQHGLKQTIGRLESDLGNVQRELASCKVDKAPSDPGTGQTGATKNQDSQQQVKPPPADPNSQRAAAAAAGSQQAGSTNQADAAKVTEAAKQNVAAQNVL